MIAKRPARSRLRRPPGLVVVGVILVTVFCLVAIRDFDYAGARTSGSDVWVDVAHGTGAANVISSIYLGARLFDTILEVLVFSVAALGVRFYLSARGRSYEAELVPESHIVRVAVGVLLPPILLLGIYVLSYGHLSPGGGFSGGVIGASGLLFAAISLGTAHVSQRMRPPVLRWMEWSVLLGLIALAALPATCSLPLLADPLPAGRMGSLMSGGSIPLYNGLIGLKVFIGAWIVIKHFVDHRGEI